MNREQRSRARDLVTHAAQLAISHKAEIHYTQDWQLRWEGINNGLIAAKGQFPHHADCSSFATWCLWQALRGGPDVVNFENWKAGYTGTLVQHGKVVSHREAVRGDVVLYGTPTYHAAIVIGRNNGELMVASHGEESGPYVVPWNTWGVNSIRRYITSETAPTPQVTDGATKIVQPESSKIYQGAPVPEMIARGTERFFGLRSAGRHALSGDNDAERKQIKKLQQRLIACGFVNHIRDPHSNWADGVYEMPTFLAVSEFQRRHMPRTQYFGQVWYDDWHKLFNL